MMTTLALNTFAAALCSVSAFANARVGNAFIAAGLGALAGANGVLVLMHMGLVP